MDYSMEDCYRVMHYLPYSKLDRQMPIKLPTNVIVNRKQLFTTIHKDFEGVDFIQIYVNSPTLVDLSDCKLSFSPMDHGGLSVLDLTPTVEVLEADTDTILTFEVDNNRHAYDVTKELTGIESLTLDFGTDASVTVMDIVFRTLDYTYTLTNISQSLIDGENYVLRGLNDLNNETKRIKEIPSTLQDYVYMAAGAYAWLTKWEYESKPMKSSQSDSNNYADRLLSQVKTALEEYLDNIDNAREDYVNLRLMNSTQLEWGL